MHPKELPPSHFFTVDVEEYFHAKAMEPVVKRDQWLAQPSRVAKSVDALLASLDRVSARGTFFVLGWLAKHRPQIVRRIADAGHEVSSHGYWHDPITRLDLKGFREDVRSSKKALEDLLGCPVVGYRAPNFSIVPGYEWAFDVLLEEGYRYDSSLFPVRRPGYGYPTAERGPHVLQRASGSLAEFPLATTKIFAYNVPAAGGGYLRQFPYTVIRRAFQEASDRGEPTTFYIHPWEVDPDQPRLPVSSVTRLRHYRGLDGALSRIDRLLAEFKFEAIADYLSRLDDHAPTPKIVGAA